MRKILIVGAGQAGLQLALSLQSHDYDVTVMSARTPEEIRSGRVMSTQCMFGPALQHERDYGLNLWEHQTPDIEGLGLSILGPDGGRALDWLGDLDDYAQSVDQRVKMSGWLELFEERGGKVVYHGVTTSDIDALTPFYDLVIIAAGKGELVQLFDRDPSRSPYTSTQRILAVVYVHGMTPRPEHPTVQAVRFNAAPGVGELFVMRASPSAAPVRFCSSRESPVVRSIAGVIGPGRPSTLSARSRSCASSCHGNMSGATTLSRPTAGRP